MEFNRMLSRRLGEDRGVTLILVTASLLFIFGVAALVVDGGLGWSERRQAQSAVDFAALAALTEATSCHLDPTTCPIDQARDAGATVAQQIAEANLPDRALDWVTCTDPGPRPGFIPSSLTDCVSFTDNIDEVRVYLPTDEVSTLFGRVLGTNVLSVRALAEAEQHIEITASILPFAPKGNGSEICLYTNQGPQSVAPCSGPASGHFGYIDLALFGNDDLNTPSVCSGGNQNAKIAVNIALGSDHILTTYQAPATVVNDHIACPNRSENPNELVIQTGSPSQVPTTDGLLDGASGTFQDINGDTVSVSALPRLRCTGPCAVVRGRNVSDAGLWTHLASGSCPTASDHASMATCLGAWNPGDGAIFDESIASDLRFGAVPAISPTAHPLNWRINEFLPVWIESIYLGCNGGTCSTIHSPGEGGGGTTCPDPADPDVFSCGWTSKKHGNSVEQVTAFQLDLRMLPQSIRDFFPGIGQSRTTALSR